MRRLPITLLSLALLGSPLLAQSTVVIPTGGGYDTTEGGSNTYGVSRYTPCRGQYIYAQKLMPAGPVTIKSIAARPDGSYTYTGGHTYEIEVFMSNNDTDPASGYSRIYASNRGADFALVMAKKKITFPAMPGLKPSPFSVAFPLDTPFPYKGKAFLVEFTTHDTPYAYYSYYLDAVSTTSPTVTGSGSLSYVGTGCPTDFYLYASGYYTGQLFYTYGYTRIANQTTPVLIGFGVSDTVWGAYTLPIDLTKYGAPGCTVFNDHAAYVLATPDPTSTSGYFYSIWGGIPINPALVASTLFGQAFTLDATYNILGLRASRGFKATIGDGVFNNATDCLHLYSYGSAAGSFFGLPTETASRYSTGRALVLELTY